ncbi:MAG: CRTAC1 family protein [Actinomycetota bacterium]
MSVRTLRLVSWTLGVAAALLVSGCPGRPPAAPPPPAVLPGFTDIASEAGISFTHDNGAYGRKLFPEMMGSGCALFDANSDGHLDVLMVNGAPMPGHPTPAPQPSRLFLNRGDGTFTDRTAGSGLEETGYGMGVAAGDVNNDGHADLYLTRLGRNSLYLNRGDGTFRDVTEAAGVGAGGYSTSAAFLDYDLDGHLDLYVCRYVKWAGLKDDFQCLNPAGKKQYCDVHVYDGQEHRLFRNRGDGRFEDATRRAGIADHVGRGLAVTCCDYDQDGDTDLFVANDETPNFLWRNEGGRFTEVAAASGFAYNEQGLATSGMGLDSADVDGNGTLDIIESDFQGQPKTLYVNEGAGIFAPNGGKRGLGDMPRSRLAFGIGFLDFDLDGWPDVFTANGHVIDDIEEYNAGIPFRQTGQLFRNADRGRFGEVSERLGVYASTPLVGRGVAFGDLDNDGDPDILVANNAGPAVLLRNDHSGKSHWIGVRCVGKRANRDGLGARVEVTAGGRRQVLEVHAARSYLSSSDPRLLFGLGASERVEKLTVAWPGGATQTLVNVPVDQHVTVTEGMPLP